VTASSAFDTLSTELVNDPDRDVSRSGDSLEVHGLAFAVLEAESLLVRLPASRADDLVSRGMATPAESPVAGGSDASARWVSITDQEDWPELAAEAHVGASGHVPGGQS